MDAKKDIRMVRAVLSELRLQTTDQRTEVLLVTSRNLQENREKVQRSRHYVGSLHPIPWSTHRRKTAIRSTLGNCQGQSRSDGGHSAGPDAQCRRPWEQPTQALRQCRRTASFLRCPDVH
ncbi:unnamed protein product [Trichogramma brassicae]|uniref:Uncharacterized protein n=1 Tax=Trichogramma brassicae TaxID=86971 RepID=A0A6H5J555_9HYME|nr:unnamed protein product [Trichogramma brassicae]